MSIDKRNPHEVRVVITGLGTTNPLGNSVKEYWDNLTKGKSGIRLLDNPLLSEYNVRMLGQIDLPDLDEYFPEKKLVSKLDRYIIMSQVAGSQAIRDSGLDIDKAPHRYGTLIGASGGIKSHYENIKRIVEGNLRRVSAFYIVGALANTGSGYVAKEWNLQGPSFAATSVERTSRGRPLRVRIIRASNDSAAA